MRSDAPFIVGELAQRWRCSDQHVYNLIRDKRLRVIRLGKLIRIPIDAVEEFEKCASSHIEESGAPSSMTQPESGIESALETLTQQRKVVRLPSGRLLTLNEPSPSL